MKNYDEVAELVNEALPGRKPRAVGNFAGQLWAFVLAMQVGDIEIYHASITSQIAIGRIAGPHRIRQVDTKNIVIYGVERAARCARVPTFKQDLLYSITIHDSV